jgi:carboxylate-amine ligase
VVRRPELNAGIDGVTRALANENLWRAQRSGIEAEMIDEAREEALPYGEALEGMLALIEEDAAALGCTAEVRNARAILRDGTSADRQIAAFEAAREAGLTNRQGLDAVVDWLAAVSRGAEAGTG